MIEYSYDFPFSIESSFGKDIIMLFAARETGQGLVEYAIIIVFVALVVVAIMRLLGPRVGNVFSSVNNSF